MHTTRHTHFLRGQVLLLGLMIMAVLTTIIGTSVLRTTVSSRTEKQVEESAKAGNVAEGLQDAALGGLPTPSSFEGIDPSVSGNIKTTSSTWFLTPYSVPQDGQYTFYMREYNPTTNTFFGTNFGANAMDIFYGDSNSETCPLIEIIEVKEDNSMKRTYSGSFSSTCSPSNISGIDPSLQLDPQDASSSENTFIVGDKTTTLYKKIAFTPQATTKILLIRPLFAGTPIGFRSTTAFKPQAKEISSTVRTIDGAQKTEKTYQLYPQIPLGLFATIF